MQCVHLILLPQEVGGKNLGADCMIFQRLSNIAFNWVAASCIFGGFPRDFPAGSPAKDTVMRHDAFFHPATLVYSTPVLPVSCSMRWVSGRLVADERHCLGDT